MGDSNKKKIIILKYHLLLLYATTNHLSVFYITIGNQFHGWTEKKLQSISQSQTCTKKKCDGHCLVVHYSFLNQGKTIVSEKYAQQIDEMHWKLQHLQTALVNRMDPILLSDNDQTDCISHNQHS